MRIGSELSKEDLRAVAKLFRLRWSADIRNWKERDTDYCLWRVICPDKSGTWHSKTGHNLAEVINQLLKDVGYA